jgi:Cys-rich protein (TIGR01571 family)
MYHNNNLDGEAGEDETKELLSEVHGSGYNVVQAPAVETAPAAAAAPQVVDYFSSDQPEFGEWRDHICACCSNMVPSCLFSTFCAPCYAGQMYEKEIGKEHGPLGSCGSCGHITGFFVVVWVLIFLFAACGRAGQAISGMLDTAWGVCLIILVFLIRQAVRKKYGIMPKENFWCTKCCKEVHQKSVFEDLICAFFCTCCTIGQMARHIYDYDTTGKSCRWTATGDLPGRSLQEVVIPKAVQMVRIELGHHHEPPPKSAPMNQPVGKGTPLEGAEAKEH